MKNIFNRISAVIFQSDGRIKQVSNYIPDSNSQKHEEILSNLFLKLFSKCFNSDVSKAIYGTKEEEIKGIDFKLSSVDEKTVLPFQLTRSSNGKEEQIKLRDELIQSVLNKEEIVQYYSNSKLTISENNSLKFKRKNIKHISEWLIKELSQMSKEVIEHCKAFCEKTPNQMFLYSKSINCDNPKCGQLNEDSLKIAFMFPQIRGTFSMSWNLYNEYNIPKTITKIELERFGLNWKKISTILLEIGYAEMLNERALIRNEKFNNNDIVDDRILPNELNVLKSIRKYPYFDPVVYSIEKKVIKYKESYSKYPESKNLNLLVWGRNEHINIEVGSSLEEIQNKNYLFLEKINQLILNSFTSVYFMDTFAIDSSIGGTIASINPDYVDHKINEQIEIINE